MNRIFIFVFALFGVLYSCSDSELLTPGDEFQTPILPGTYSAELDGTLFDFSETVSATSNDAMSSIDGTNEEGQTIKITFQNPLEEGTYNQTSGGALIILTLGGDLGNFMNISAAGQFLPLTVKITELNMADMVVTGSFSGEVLNIASGETLEITNGIFKEIPFTMQDGGDGILKGLFDNVLLDFSNNAQATGQITNAVISGENDEMQTLRIIVPEGIDVGTFTEEDEVIFEVSLGTTPDPNEIYTNYDEVNDEYLPVTVVITEITQDVNGRVKGTFSGTIKKFNGGTGEEIEITAGEIDVPIVVSP
jgi:hypothetical protein